MKNLIYIATLLFIMGCSKNDLLTYPKCLDAEITTLLQSPVENPKATVKKYTYQGKTVYLINSHFADGLDPVYNDNCQLICTQGGIAGNTNNSCINWDSAVYIETVWTDPR